MVKSPPKGGVKGGHAAAISMEYHDYHSIDLQDDNNNTDTPAENDVEYWPKGFTNVGNSCYANATLQCLLSTALTDALLDPKTVPLFRKYSSNANLLAMGSGSVDSEDDILKSANRDAREKERQRRDREKRNMTENCEWLTEELTRITEDYVSGPPIDDHTQGGWGWSIPHPTSENVVDPGSITRFPDRLSRCLTPYQQEDAHEFLRALLSTLVMNGHNKQLSSLFDGLLESAVTCQTCGRASMTRDRYMDLSLDINDPDIRTLDDALYEYTRTEVLDAENSVYCQKCEKKQSVTKGLRLATAPSILVCHLKRFAFDCYGRLVRLHKQIKFPMRLEIGEYMSNLNKARPPPYELVGILVHQGQTCASGHYLAYVKKDGEWYRCNDSIVTKVDEETVLNQQAYIMMYEVAEMREKTCSPSSPVNMKRKQTQMPYVDTNNSVEMSKDDFSTTLSVKSEVPKGPGMPSTQQQQQPQDSASKLFQFLTAAEGGLSSLLSDLCCDGCNTAVNEPKERRMQPQRRRRRKQPLVLREDYLSFDPTDDDSTVGTSDDSKMRKCNSSGSLSNLVEIERSNGSHQHRSRTPRQRTHSFSNSEPGLDMKSPYGNGNQSTRSENAFRKHRTKRNHSSKPKPTRERSRSVHASGDYRELPPLPTPGHHRRAKSISASRKKGYFI
jgi:hypothetical protein